MRIYSYQRRLQKSKRRRRFVSSICGRAKTGTLKVLENDLSKISGYLLDFRFLVCQGKSFPFCGTQCPHHLENKVIGPDGQQYL